MSVRIYIGGTRCPSCGGMLFYSGNTYMEIYNAKYMSFDKKWQVVKTAEVRFGRRR